MLLRQPSASASQSESSPFSCFLNSSDTELPSRRHGRPGPVSRERQRQPERLPGSAGGPWCRRLQRRLSRTHVASGPRCHPGERQGPPRSVSEVFRSCPICRLSRKPGLFTGSESLYCMKSSTRSKYKPYFWPVVAVAWKSGQKPVRSVFKVVSCCPSYMLSRKPGLRMGSLRSDYSK